MVADSTALSVLDVTIRSDTVPRDLRVEEAGSNNKLETRQLILYRWLFMEEGEEGRRAKRERNGGRGKPYSGGITWDKHSLLCSY